MIYNVVCEGNTFPVEAEIGNSDEAVKRALTPFFPEAANAMITRAVQGEVTTITVVKRAGSKGVHPPAPSGTRSGFGCAKGDPLAALRTCPGGKNPAIQLYEEIEAQENAGELDPERVLALDERIEQACTEGEEQAQAVKSAARRLAKSQAQPAPGMVLGF